MNKNISHIGDIIAIPFFIYYLKNQNAYFKLHKQGFGKFRIYKNRLV